MSKVIVRARVRILIEIDVSDSWGGDVKLEQVNNQASESALKALRKGLVVDQMTDGGKPTPLSERPQVRIVGTPKVEAILVLDEQR